MGAVALVQRVTRALEGPGRVDAVGVDVTGGLDTLVYVCQRNATHRHWYSRDIT